MKLKELLSEFVELDKYAGELQSITVGNIQHEIARCDDQSILFYLLTHKGHKQENNCYADIEEAISRNVLAIVLDISDIYYDVRDIQNTFEDRVLLVPIVELHKKISVIASKFYKHPSHKLEIVGVTGTNGKTSISHFIAQSLHALGYQTAVIGSIGYGVYGNHLTKSEWTDYRKGYTTPHPIDLQKILSDFVAQKVQFVSMEITSHSLIWHSLLGVRISTAIFTNVTEDHIEYHGTRYNYAEAKKILFNYEFWPSITKYIINIDDSIGYSIFKKLEKVIGLNVYTYSARHVSDVEFDHNAQCTYASDINLDLEQSTFNIRYLGSESKISTSLVGSYYVDNILAVFMFLKSMAIEDSMIISCLNCLKKISGRMELFKKADTPTTIVDFGHNPDGIEKTLSTLKTLTQGKLFCVFGCPGDNNTDARHQMASVVEFYADNIIITMSNPYYENPDKIISELFDGFKNKSKVKIIGNRAEAILDTFNSASKNDVILVTGKGSQQYIVMGDSKIPHSDIECVKSLYE